MNSPNIDMKKVRAALERYGPSFKPAKPRSEYHPVATDSAIRKPLKAHGVKCTGGFYHSNFLNNDR